MIGAVIGPISRPESIVAGRYTDTGQLVIIGRSVPLSSAQAAPLASVLEPAGPGHPWPDTVLSSRFGNGRDRVTLTKVKPAVVAEDSVDTVRQTGEWRHGFRYPRFRPELQPVDLPVLPAPAPQYLSHPTNEQSRGGLASRPRRNLPGKERIRLAGRCFPGRVTRRRRDTGVSVRSGVTR